MNTKVLVSDFTISHDRQIKVQVSYLIDTWGIGFSQTDTEQVCGVYYPQTQTADFWFPAGTEYPKSLRGVSLEAVMTIWGKTFGKVDVS